MRYGTHSGKKNSCFPEFIIKRISNTFIPARKFSIMYKLINLLFDQYAAAEPKNGLEEPKSGLHGSAAAPLVSYIH